MLLSKTDRNDRRDLGTVFLRVFRHVWIPATCFFLYFRKKAKGNKRGKPQVLEEREQRVIWFFMQPQQRQNGVMTQNWTKQKKIWPLYVRTRKLFCLHSHRERARFLSQAARTCAPVGFLHCVGETWAQTKHFRFPQLSSATRHCACAFATVYFSDFQAFLSRQSATLVIRFTPLDSSDIYNKTCV